MEEKGTYLVKKELFGEDLVNALRPENLRRIAPNELNPFSDYYGALLGIEKFLAHKEEYQKADPEDFPYNLMRVEEILVANLFVPNYKTLRGKLNDRVRRLLCREKILGGAESLEELVKQLSVGKEKIARAYKLGFSSSDKKRLEEELRMNVRRLLDYSELLQSYLFKLRPQIIKDHPDISGLLKAQRQVFKFLKGKRDDYLKVRARFGEKLSVLELEGEPITEGTFFYKGREYNSTKAFVKEWDRVIKMIEHLEELKEKPAKRKWGRKWGRRAKRKFSFKLKKLSFKLPKKAMAITLGGLVSTAGMLYAFPSWRYNLGLPVSIRERIEILYNQGSYNDSLSILKQSEGMDKHWKSYWWGKIKLAKFKKTLQKETSLSRRYKLGKDLMVLGAPELVEQGKPEVDEEEILKVFFDVGYVKRKDNIAFINDYHTLRRAAQSHLANLFSQPVNSMEPEEARLLKVVQKSDVLYIGQDKNNVYFLASGGKEIKYTSGGKEIKYTLNKKGDKYEVIGITIK